MSDGTHIEWADATWSPLSGCTRVSAGCDHCYIERTPPFRMAHRKFDGDGPGSTTGVILHPDRLDQPLHWRKPRRVFVNSLADLFHEAVPDEFIAQVFAVMALAPQHTFQLLTKRHARMRSLLAQVWFPELVTTWAWRISSGAASRLPKGGSDYSPSAVAWPLPNVWLGVSVESQQWADIRIPALLDTPAAVRFLSCEPLLGSVDLCNCYPYGYSPATYAGPQEHCWIHGRQPVDWVITGGESGPGARPAHPDWFRSIRDQCQAAGVAYLHKQNGEWLPTLDGATHRVTLGGDFYQNPPGCLMSNEELISRVGKKRAGRLLDGRTWDEYPEAVA